MKTVELTRHEYGDFVTRHPERRVFHGLPWLDAVCRGYGVGIRFLGLQDGNHLVGAIPVVIRKKMGVSLYGSPLPQTGTPPSVPILAPLERCEEVLRAVEDWVRENRIWHFQVTWPGPLFFHPSARARVEQLDNLEIELSARLKLNWNLLSDLPKRGVKRAVRSGVKLHWYTGHDALQRYSVLLDSTYDRQGLRPNFPLSMYQSVQALVPRHSMKILSATHEGRVIAAVWLLCDANRCHYWDASSLQAYRELSAGHLLVWELIRWSALNGYRVLDMVGTSIGGRGGSRPGIGRFKQSFGAKPVVYSVVYWQAGWLVAALAMYRLLARIQRRIALVLSGGIRNTSAKIQNRL
jgi:hypothetical protein